MIKRLIFFFLIILFNSSCSLDTKSGIWTEAENIKRDTSLKSKTKKLFEKKITNLKEINANLIIDTPLKIEFRNDNKNNPGPLLVNDNFSKKIKYKFSKIKNFQNYKYDLIFDKNSLIFFDKKGSIIKFNDDSKILWKKNFYTKTEKKLFPILNFSTNGKLLIVSDSLSKFYALNLKTGELVWTKNHDTIFTSNVKIDNNNFFVIDAKNKINCFSLMSGDKVWDFKADDSLIKSQNKLSIVLDNEKVYFNNTIGDIYSLDKNSGALIWITPIRESNLSEQSFLVKTSKLVLDNENLYFSNNQNSFFSLGKSNGYINWTQNINSDLTPVVFRDYIFTISTDGYFIIIDKVTGSIIRTNDLFKNLSKRKKLKKKLLGFILSDKNVYLSVNNGKILKFNISNADLLSTYNIGGKEISKPFINNKKMFIIKSNEIVKLF